MTRSRDRRQAICQPKSLLSSEVQARAGAGDRKTVIVSRGGINVALRGALMNTKIQILFLSQVITFSDANLEKFYQFTRHLLRKLKLPDDPLPLEITKNINMDSYRIQQTSSGTIKLMDEDGELKPISALGTGRPQQEDPAPLSQIIEYINDHFGTDFTSVDKVKFFAENMGRRLEDQEGLRRALDTGVNPSEDTRKLAFDTFFGEALEDMIDSDFDIYKKIKDDSNFGALFRAVMYRRIAAAVQSRAAIV